LFNRVIEPVKVSTLSNQLDMFFSIIVKRKLKTNKFQRGVLMPEFSQNQIKLLVQPA